MHCPSLSELPQPPSGKDGWPWTGQSPSLPDKMPDGRPWPKISVVTPSYNQGNYIEETIRSVLLQSYPNLEYVIIDGGSTDNSVEIINKYEAWLTYWVSEKDRGQSHAINKGLKHATGDIFHWLNSDDQFTQGALEAAARAVRSEPDAVAWAGSCARVDPDGRILSVVRPQGLTKDELANWATNQIYQPACFIEMETLRDIGGLDESLYIAFDFDLWLKLADKGRLAKVDSELAKAIVHPEAKTQADHHLIAYEHVAVLFRHGCYAQAKDYITRMARSEVELRKKIERVTSNPVFKLLRPLLKRMGLVG